MLRLKKFRQLRRRRKNSGLCANTEVLESRAMLTGNVLVAFVDGDLIVQGDEADNSLQIEVSTEGDVTVRGLDGTTINGGDSFVIDFPPPTAFGLTGRPDDVKIRMGKGNDAVFINGLAVKDDIEILSGPGNDTVVLDSVSTDDLLFVRSGSGEDRIAIDNSKIGGRLDIQTDSGNDVVFIDSTTVAGRTRISTGHGDDTVVLNGANNFGGRVDLNGGRGFDTVQIDDASEFALRFNVRRFESKQELVSLVRFAADEGLSVRNIPAGDPAGTGSTTFSLSGANFSGGEVVIFGFKPLYASPPSAYRIDFTGGTITFDEPVDVAKFFFVHPEGVPAQTATAYDVDGNVLATVSSNETTFLGDPANFILLAGTSPIARIEITGGVVDNFQFV